MIKFKVSESEFPVVDFDNTSTGIVIQADMADVRRWKMVMLQFHAVQEEITKALNDALNINGITVHDSEQRQFFPKSGVEVKPDPEPPIPTAQAVQELLGAQSTTNGLASRSELPVEQPAPSIRRNGMTTESVQVSEQGGPEKVAYNSAGYQGSGKLVMSQPEVPAPEMLHDGVVKRGPGRPRKNP